jgi:SpoVK/Ycf46/Vps4 family AAA+-type ATPase
LVLDAGSLLGSLVGQSNGSGDSGVSSRRFGTFLSWLNDHESNVFVVCTANDVSRLPPEFGRSERFDRIFVLDLLGRSEKDAIWQIYREHFEISSDQRQPDDSQWTEAEIRACCRLAALLDMPLTAAAQNVVPVAVTAAESVDRLRSWASGRCLSAERAGVYQREVAASGTRRWVSREGANN